MVEQIGAPQEIYDLPATMFVADFVGSPPMNFIPFEGQSEALRPRGDARRGEHRHSRDPRRRTRQNRSCSACVPSTSPFSNSAPIRGRVFGAEYLGTTQIVTVDIEQGQIKARLPSRLPVRAGETVGLAFKSEFADGVRPRDRAGHPKRLA